MKIFLSYSSKDRARAEELHLALLEHGHDVFFDRADLPAGDSFHDRIREEIFGRQLFLFLASRNSLRQSSYCLSELKFCRERWPHPRRRVLTVLLDELSAEELPPYLRAVGVLRAEGNLPAETAAAVEVLARRTRRRKWLATLALVTIAILGASWALMQRADATIEIVQPRIAPLQRGLGGSGDRYLIRGTLFNRSREPMQVTAAWLSTDLGLRLLEADPRALLPRDWSLDAGEQREFALPFELLGEMLPMEQLKAHEWIVSCTIPGKQPVYGPAAHWAPGADFEFPKAIPLPEQLRHRLRALVVDPQGEDFLVAADDPCSLARLTPQGNLETLLTGEGQALAIAAGEDLIVLGTSAEPSLHAFRISTQSALEALEIPRLQLALENDSRPVSTRIRELAVHQGWIWVLTGKEDEAAGFLAVGPEHNTISRPPFLEEFAPISDLRLRVLDERLWGVRSGTSTPGLFEFFEPHLGGYESYAGSEVAEAGWAGDLAERPGEGFLAMNRSGELVELRLLEGRLATQKVLAKLPIPECDEGCRRDVRLATRGQRVLVAVNTWTQGPGEILSTQLFSFEPATGIEAVFEAQGWEAWSIATTAQRGLVLLASGEKGWDALEIRY